MASESTERPQTLRPELRRSEGPCPRVQAGFVHGWLPFPGDREQKLLCLSAGLSLLQQGPQEQRAATCHASMLCRAQHGMHRGAADALTAGLLRCRPRCGQRRSRTTRSRSCRGRDRSSTSSRMTSMRWAPLPCPAAAVLGWRACSADMTRCAD